jgi:hypothetical protein
MKIRKNIEGLFLVAVAFVTLTAYASAGVPTFHHASKNAQLRAAVAEANMSIVTVTHKRLTAAEKNQLN